VVHETHQAWAKLVKGTVEDEASAAANLPKQPLSPHISGLKKSTLKRNLSVPSLDALQHVEHCLLNDEVALDGALKAAGQKGEH